MTGVEQQSEIRMVHFPVETQHVRARAGQAAVILERNRHPQVSPDLGGLPQRVHATAKRLFLLVRRNGTVRRARPIIAL